MSIRIGWLALASIAVVSVGTAHAQVNGTNEKLRVFNDFSTTNLTSLGDSTVNQGPGASQILLQETLWADDGIGGDFANRHDYTLSSDNGATDHIFSIDDSYTVKTLVTLSAGSNSPRKEAGFIIDSPLTGTAQFIINSNGGNDIPGTTGEIVAFGGPFHCFHCGADPDYVTGTTILMGYTMRAAGDGNGPGQNTIEYFIDRGLGLESSGQLPWGNLEGGPTTYKVSLYSQASPDLQNSAEFVTTNFNDIMFGPPIPEPSTIMMSVLAMLGLAGVHRGRTR